MLQGQLVLAHLRQDCTNVQVNVAWVRNLEALVHCLLTEVQVVILDLERLLEVGERTSQFLGATEDASEVIVCDGTVPVTFFCQTDCLMQQLE